MSHSRHTPWMMSMTATLRKEKSMKTSRRVWYGTFALLPLGDEQEGHQPAEHGRGALRKGRRDEHREGGERRSEMADAKRWHTVSGAHPVSPQAAPHLRCGVSPSCPDHHSISLIDRERECRRGGHQSEKENQVRSKAARRFNAAWMNASERLNCQPQLLEVPACPVRPAAY